MKRKKRDQEKNFRSGFLVSLQISVKDPINEPIILNAINPDHLIAIQSFTSPDHSGFSFTVDEIFTKQFYKFISINE